MKSVLKFFFVSILIFLISTQVYSIRNAGNAFSCIGIFGGIDYNIHNTEFQNLRGIPNCCPSFDGAGGFGGKIAIFWETPLSRNFSFRLESGADIINGKFDAEEKEIIAGDEPITATIEHVLNVNILSGYFGAGVNYKPLKNLNLMALVDFSFPIIKDFSQKEALVSPEYGTFENGSRVRNNIEGELPDIPSMLIFVSVGAGWDINFPLSRRTVLTPEIKFIQSVNSLSESIDWRVSSVYIGIAFKYYFGNGISTPLSPVN